MVKVEILDHKNYKFLFLDDHLWMWDTPDEKELQENLSRKAYGDVLVVGYGFGILTKLLLSNPKVNSVITVEKFLEVIDKVNEFGPIYGEIIVSDFYDLQESKKFDCVIGDIWPDIDENFLQDYIKFKEKAKKLLREKGKVLAWGQDYFEYLLKTKRS